MADKTEPKYKVKVPKLNATKRTYSFTLSLPGMISAMGVGVLALTFFFVMGILIGRGYRPEADIPQLEPIMPSNEHGQVAGQEPPTVLTPEELDYQDRLKAPAESVMDEPAPKPAPKPKPVPKPEPKRAEAKPEAKPAAAEAPVRPGEPVFDYVYQVAAFRKVEMAEALGRKLEAAGLTTHITSGDSKGSTWYRVQVLHTGTPASTEGMREVLARFGIQKPLLKKKSQVQ
ncbi:MAG: SPOR domain-containing protein [Desulfovibrionaceae bacterium]|nr:SPOR domain-containing protein [Desulfovibrionaceae bacterium]